MTPRVYLFWADKVNSLLLSLHFTLIFFFSLPWKLKLLFSYFYLHLLVFLVSLLPEDHYISSYQKGIWLNCAKSLIVAVCPTTVYELDFFSCSWIVSDRLSILPFCCNAYIFSGPAVRSCRILSVRGVRKERPCFFFWLLNAVTWCMLDLGFSCVSCFLNPRWGKVIKSCVNFFDVAL